MHLEIYTFSPYNGLVYKKNFSDLNKFLHANTHSNLRRVSDNFCLLNIILYPVTQDSCIDRCIIV